MPTRLVSVVVDSADPQRLARWWGDALGWSVSYEDEHESDIAAPDRPEPELVFVPVEDRSPGKNRVHLDLATAGDGEPAVSRQRLLAAGATDLDIGQGEVERFVMADPEGNAFCVLEPRDYGDTGAVAAIVVDCVDPAPLARFWAAASGWAIGRESDRVSTLRAPDGRGPLLAFARTGEPHTVKNRWHLDVRPYAGDDQAAEVDRLLALGARHAEVGQSQAPPETVTWVVLADPELNEFCVLSPKD